jgi:hypothetical protein
MKLTGPACTEALNGAEKARRRKRTPGNAGGVRVERKVRPSTEHWHPEPAARLDSSLLEREREFMPTSPKGKRWSYRVKMKAEMLK